MIVIKTILNVDKDKVIGKIDPRMWGSFTEHVGRSIYNGVYQPDHPSADEDGFRTDVIEAVKKLNVPLIRYPGGNFVSGYNWEDGIGPKEKRPTKLDLAWQSIEINQFGLHEFIKWCKKVGAEPDMAVNMGTRDIDAARNLVEYCNFPKGTYWSDLRRKNGAEEPFNIKVWSIGNEMDGDWQIGHDTAEEYGRAAHETAKVMKLIDPSIELVASGSSLRTMDTFGTWEETLLDYVYDNVDYLSLHQYYDNYDNDIDKFLGWSEDFDGFINDVVSICDAVKARRHSDKKINLAMDEWNVWYHTKKADVEQEPWQKAPHLLEDHYNFEDALLVGALANVLMEHADRVKIGCLAQLVNVIAPIMTNNDGSPSLWYQSIFYPFMQVSNYGQGYTLDVNKEVSSYSIKGQKYLSSSSTVVYNPESKEIVVFVENKTKEPMDFESNFTNFQLNNVVEATKFCGYDLKQTNEDQDMKLEKLGEVDVSSKQIVARLQPYSWNMIRVSVKE